MCEQLNNFIFSKHSQSQTWNNVWSCHQQMPLAFKWNLIFCCFCWITPKRVMSLRGPSSRHSALAARLLSKKCRCGNTVFNLTGLRFELQTSRSREERVSARHLCNNMPITEHDSDNIIKMTYTNKAFSSLLSNTFLNRLKYRSVQCINCFTDLFKCSLTQTCLFPRGFAWSFFSDVTRFPGAWLPVVWSQTN